MKKRGVCKHKEQTKYKPIRVREFCVKTTDLSLEGANESNNCDQYVCECFYIKTTNPHMMRTIELEK